MIQIYTTPSCASCRKAKKWFDQYGIPYFEKNILLIIYMPFFGYISLIILFCVYELEHQHLLKFIYKIANIGVDIQEDEEVD